MIKLTSAEFLMAMTALPNPFAAKEQRVIEKEVLWITPVRDQRCRSLMFRLNEENSVVPYWEPLETIIIEPAYVLMSHSQLSRKDNVLSDSGGAVGEIRG